MATFRGLFIYPTRGCPLIVAPLSRHTTPPDSPIKSAVSCRVRGDDEITRKLSMLIEGECEGEEYS